MSGCAREAVAREDRFELVKSNGALSTYLDDHLVGATAGVRLARRTASSHAGGSAEAFLRGLVDEIAEDRQTLIDLQRHLGLERSSLKAAAGWAAAKLTRLKLGHVFSRDRRLSRVLELETLSLGIAGKLALWESLKTSIGAHPGDIDLQDLIDRAERQRTGVERCRLDVAQAAFGSHGDGTTKSS
jgi:hypothetical protein